MLAHRTERWTLVRLCVASALLTACASSPQRSARRDFRFQLAELAPVLLTLLDSDNAVGELEEQLKECARLAESQRAKSAARR